MLKKSMMAATLLLGIASPAFTSPALAQQTQMPSQQQGQRQSPFERADANNDGVITREEVRVVRTTAFTRLDANRDGFLVREEMPRPREEPRDRTERGGQGPIGQQLPNGRVVSRGGINLSAADSNNDGTITRAEFDAAYVMEVSAYAAEPAAERSSMFIFLDTDRNGSISQAEVSASNGRSQSFRRTATKPVQSGDGATTGELMRRSEGPRRPNPDTNNDQKVSLAEWLARPDPLFDRGDTNKDGRVTREEAASIVRQGRINVSSTKRPW